eukprot:4382941-Pyramimonas_sp.AAC.1
MDSLCPSPCMVRSEGHELDSGGNITFGRYCPCTALGLSHPSRGGPSSPHSPSAPSPIPAAWSKVTVFLPLNACNPPPPVATEPVRASESRRND